MVTISASTHRTLLFRVSSVSLSLLSLYALLYLHVSALYSEIHDSYNNYEINNKKRLDQDRSQNSRVNEHESANKGVKCRESKKKKSSQANFRKIKISPDRISF